jgi:hypothetical protein
MGTVLDVEVGPEPLGPRIVALVEQGLEGFEHEGFVLFGCCLGHVGLLV